MDSKLTVTVLALLALYVASTRAASIGSAGGSLRCQCVKTMSEFINPKFMKNIEIVPSGPHCSNAEIIVTLKSTNRVCLDPQAPWVKRIINRVMNGANAEGH
ncbi:interleukin-8-like [Callorhinchus milii]|uniref:C-X-C motif chemokine n=2 Tax=Callorhinchus milii TaxID=7868 RepID=V9L9W2_CALMI|nr:interleukin-8 [Callorhinchus milii]XP_042193630.1 interleukin-8-like [Callorhinchus milii]|eukprot:gi/632989080/ref/XP_007883457.1/ PREDICTED: interleukin-8-like [Callorhinchus milii]